MSAIAERVAAGAAFLDEYDPDWWRAVNLITLDLNDGGLCILGQRCPQEVLRNFDLDADPENAYVAHLRHLASGGDEFEQYDWAIDHGFISRGPFEPGLTAEWKRVIGERRD